MPILGAVDRLAQLPTDQQISLAQLPTEERHGFFDRNRPNHHAETRRNRPSFSAAPPHGPFSTEMELLRSEARMRSLFFLHVSSPLRSGGPLVPLRRIGTTSQATLQGLASTFSHHQPRRPRRREGQGTCVSWVLSSFVIVFCYFEKLTQLES